MHETVRELLEATYAPQKSDEWLRLREGMLTASDAATALGVNPYEKPKDLILKKCGRKHFDGNFATVHGNKYEDEARDIYCARFGEVAHEIGLRQHPKYPWLGGSPDGLTESGKLLEIKCPIKRDILPEVPVYYMPQLQLLMEILNLEECVFIQYKPSELTWPRPAEFVTVNVSRDREWFETNLPVLQDLWTKVEWHREHGCDELVKKPRAVAVRKVKEHTCEIIDTDSD